MNSFRSSSIRQDTARPSPRIAFFGTSEFVGSVQKARFLRRLIAAGVRPAVVVTAPDAPSGRGKQLTPPAVKSAALEFGLPVLQPATLAGFSEELARRESELLLVAAYGKILPPDALAVPKFGSLNAHPSLLPRWRGPTPIQAALVAGDAVTGITIIQMDEKMDHGPIIAQREFPLGGRAWTALELSDALTDLGAELFLEILEPWSAGRIQPRPQDDSQATYTKPLKKEDGMIDWRRRADEIERMVRAFLPWPGTYTFWQRADKRVRLVIEGARCKVQGASDEMQGARGTVQAMNGELAVSTGSELLIVDRLKLEGGRSMPGRDFFRGHPDIIGAILT